MSMSVVNFAPNCPPGLFISFQLESVSVNGQPAQPTLSAQFGDVASESSAIAVWFLTSTLQGTFSNFNATFAFVNPLGIPEAGLDIIDSLDVRRRGCKWARESRGRLSV